MFSTYSLRAGQQSTTVMLIVMSLLLALVAAYPVLPRSTVICGPASWQDIVIFYLLNYGAHAVTIKSFPGERTSVSIMWVVAALLLPYSSIVRACVAITRGTSRKRSDLMRAARARAFCEVVRVQDTPTRRPLLDHQNIITAWLTAGPLVSHTMPVHGQIFLPSGYGFKILQRPVEFPPTLTTSIELSKSYSVVKALVSIIQLLSSIFTLYETRRLQLEQYGYVAYGFTVIPYATMTLINLFANMVTPDFPTLYMVRTETMDEAERLGGKFIGVVASVYETTVAAGHEQQTENEVTSAHETEAGDIEMSTIAAEGDATGQAQAINPSRSATQRRSSGEIPSGNGEQCTSPRSDIVPNGRFVDDIERTVYEKALYIGSMLIFYCALATPYAIMGGLTHFNPGQSTKAQRVWIMIWIVIGQTAGYTAPMELFRKGESHREFYVDKGGEGGEDSSALAWIKNKFASPGGWRFILFYAAPAIGGLVVVGQMIIASGTCGVFG